MEQVNHVIKELLYDHNCVIIPNFGAFIANKTNTHVHPITNTFSPPSKKIAFNKSINKNDGLLIKEFALHANIPDTESENVIKAYATELKSRIQTEKIVKIEEIGTFRVDVEGNIQFRPDDSLNFLNDSFGLPELYIKPIEKNITMTQQPITPRREPIRNKPKQEQKEEKKESSNKLFLIIPILLILLGVASLFIVEDGEGNVYMASLFPSLKTEIVDSDEMSSSNEDMEGMEEEMADETISAVSYRYHIIAGVFREKDNADRLVAQTDAGQVLNIDEYYKVSISSFSSEAEAEAELQNYTDQYGSDIWVLEE